MTIDDYHNLVLFIEYQLLEICLTICTVMVS